MKAFNCFLIIEAPLLQTRMMTVLLLTEAFDNILLTERNDNECDSYVSEQKCKGVFLFEWQWVPYVSEQNVVIKCQSTKSQRDIYIWIPCVSKQKLQRGYLYMKGKVNTKHTQRMLKKKSVWVSHGIRNLHYIATVLTV